MEKPLTERIERHDGLIDIAAYEASDGYAGARKALMQMAPEEVVDLAAGLAKLEVG